MDISKLPKLSQSDAPPPTVVTPEVSPPAQQIAPSSNRIAEAWISIAIGIVLLLYYPHTVGYFSSKVFHTPFAPFADPTRPAPAKCDFIMYTDGTRIFYPDLPEFWSDLVITLFAMVLIIDGLLMIRVRRPAVALIAFCLTISVTFGNLAYLIATFSNGIAIISALAVIFGGYIAISQWNTYKSLVAARAGSTSTPDL